MKETRISIRFPEDVLEALQRLAKQQDRSFNGEVVWAVRQFIKQEEGHGDQSPQDPPESDA